MMTQAPGYGIIELLWISGSAPIALSLTATVTFIL
jgi:hypothetical protein